MAKLRINGDSSGYVDLSAPNAASSSTLDLDQVPQKNAATTAFTGSHVIIGDTTTGNAHANADDLVIGNTSSNKRTGLTIVSANNQDGAIMWSDGTSSGNANIQGQLVYNHPDNSMRFYTAVSEGMRISGDGYVTKPKQPVFRAIHSGSSVSLQNQYFPWNVVSGSYNSFDIGNNFRVSSSGNNAHAFTCPVAGRYYFVVTTICNTVNTNGAWYIRKNNSAVVEQHTSQTSSGWVAHTMHAVLNCAANDYINIWVGGTTLNMYGTAWGHFSGYLIG